MKESLLTAEILQTRSDAIVNGIQKAIENGLDPRKLQEIESNQWSRWHHRDLFGVYLGLKPLFREFGPHGIPQVYKTYKPDDTDTYLQYLPQEKDTGVRTLWNNGLVLNPMLVASIFDKHRKILTDNDFLNPHDEEEFTKTITILHGPHMPEEADVLLGLLYGYPESAASLFSKFGGLKVRDIMNKIWYEADYRGHKLPYTPPIGTMHLADNANGVRDDLARLIQLPGFAPEELGINKDVIDYALLVRSADIPYFPFATIMNSETGRHITHNEEAKMRRDYEASKMDEKLIRLLSSV
jgi:hypothetical protein